MKDSLQLGPGVKFEKKVNNVFILKLSPISVWFVYG